MIRKLVDIYKVISLRKRIGIIVEPLSTLHLKKRYSRKTKFLISIWLNFARIDVKKGEIKYRYQYLCQRINSDKHLEIRERSYLMLINTLIYSLLFTFLERKYFFTNLPSLLSR